MKFAICNELYEQRPFEEICRSVAEIGYTGLEIAPFTLAPLITDVDAERRALLKRQASDAGVEIIGLHWLFAKTTGFHLNSTDEAVRVKSADYLRALADAAADLGGSILVLGSPDARRIPEGTSNDEALKLAADTLSRACGTLADRGVTLCIEPLAPTETDFLQTADEGARLMKMVDHPNVQLHLDVKAMSSETPSIPEIVATHLGHTGHFHANDANLRGPGMGETDFRPIFQALLEHHYDKWVSVEVFDFKPDPETIARESLAYMKQCLADIGAAT
ncbi:D-tagatose 3-epimerase [Planctomycetes bacterium Pan216]|uniref:D-tagatose 3-epimerase n=1 Tax=Kolteria novifilia TaxID=2527975 RepID=A0A518B0K7_9BACT|nr:D-tagatose 3-epimerase [Planctomycetes bacterium Pan216]